MENNNNNYNENNNYSENNNYNTDNANTANNAQNANTEPDGSYGYSYIGQQNPNNIWRADEQANTQNTESGAYNSYHHIYGNPNGQYRTSSEEKRQKQEENARRRAQKAAGANSGFAIKLAKCASIALVFGLVAGTAFEGAGYATSRIFGTDSEQTEAPAKNEQTTQALPNTSSTNGQTSAVSLSSRNSADVKAIAKNCMPSIVAITNLSEVQYRNFFGQAQSYEVPSKGSGVIVSEDDEYLYIATNNHVVESASTLTIQFCDDSTVAAEIKGTDKSTDLAVVKVKKSDIEKDTLSEIKVATFGNSDECEVGSAAIAIGNALGYGQSVTAGIVSAVEREVTLEDDSTGESFTNDLIQTDAAINPGNSGGALLNDKGEVIGINSSKYSDTKVEGMGFAIPANTAKPIIEDLISKEKVEASQAAYLGISGADVNSTISQMYGMPEGVFVTEVTNGTAAEKCGLKKGDIITKFDGKAVKSMQALKSRLAYYKAGDEVTIAVERSVDGGYEEQELTVVLDKKNS